jgi:hypothetical protein
MTAGAGDDTTLHESRSVSIAPGDTDREDLKSTTYEFFILAISVMSILNMALLLCCRSNLSPGGLSRSSTPS